MKLPTLAPLALLAAPLAAQDWGTAWTHPGDDAYVGLDYPVVFVATTGHADGPSETPPHFGLDVISANNPAPHGPGGGLWVLLPGTGAVEKLFPLPVHETTPGLLDTPVGALAQGAVVEPNVSEDGRIVHFGWFHDQEWKKDGGGWQELKLSYKGCDLYSLDLGPLIDDPSVDPATLTVRRLTSTAYAGNPKGLVQETSASKYEHAINGNIGSASVTDYWGNVDMHMIEMRQEDGLKAVWVSNRARVLNSNKHLGDANHNFNLYIADILEDGSLGPVNQFQYYTTTSALSPIPLRNGLAFSYQSSTEMFRRWDIQAVSSSGVWTPLIGYAHASELFHLGTYLVESGPGGDEDVFIGLKYYNLNDGGFGQLHRIDLEDKGINVFNPSATQWATQPEQLSTLLTLGVIAQDAPSPQVLVDGELRYVGKFSSPRAGRKGGEYLMAYTPTSANRWLVDADGLKGQYEAYITYRPSTEPFEPWEPVDVAAGKGQRTVVRDASGAYDLAWPTPMLSWQERYGMPQQEFDGSIVDATTPIARGEPFAQVGTSAIYNTDIRPYDCYKGGSGVSPWNPNDEAANEEVKMWQNVDGLRYVQDPNNFCQYLLPETVLGIAVNLTSNRTDPASLDESAFTTDGNKETGANGRKEAASLLGIYAPGEHGQNDSSFLARIPADVPFEFHLVDARYGMKLVDVRSWHALKPRESRTDCGGCHQHEAGFAIPFEGTDASFAPAMDMTGSTRLLTYDEDCKPVLATSEAPAVRYPEWKADVWPGIDQHCSACHDANVSIDGAALDAYAYTDEESAYDVMKERRYANAVQGALGSPAFWAAYGERTDGRDNDLPGYQPNYAGGYWGYKFSPVHAAAPGLCAAENPEWADWVRQFGQWIDNHMPRDGSSPYGYKFDRYHPTVDFGISLQPFGIRFGFWDDSGDPMTARFALNGNPVATAPGLENGSFVVAPPSGPLTSRIQVTLVDASGNRQIVEKTLQDLVEELQSELGL